MESIYMNRELSYMEKGNEYEQKGNTGFYAESGVIVASV